MRKRNYMVGLGLLALIGIGCDARNEMYERQINMYQDSIVKLNERIIELEDEDLNSRIERNIKDLEEKDLSKSPAFQELNDLYKELLEELKKPPKTK